MTLPGNTDVLVLCGGLGKRLSPVVSDRPKPMAEVGGRPFLDILLAHASKYGFRRYILCAGHKAGSIVEHYKTSADIQTVVSVEDKPLGTGGAVKNAEQHIRSETFIVMNGDSYCPANLGAFLDFHEEHNALISMLVVKPKDENDYGNVVVNNDGEVTLFSEKTQRNDDSMINAGIYVFDREVLSKIPEGRAYSLEHELFPSLTNRGFYAFLSDADLLDIGTPERYEEARRRL